MKSSILTSWNENLMVVLWFQKESRIMAMITNKEIIFTLTMTISSTGSKS